MTDLIPIDHSWISNAEAPIYLWVFPAKTDDATLQQFIDARESWAKRAAYPVAWVVELSNLVKAPAHQRRMVAEHLKTFEAHDVRWNAGSALVVPGAWLRGVVTAVFWMVRPKFPHQSFSNREDAMTWARQQLDDVVHGRRAPATKRRAKMGLS